MDWTPFVFVVFVLLIGVATGGICLGFAVQHLGVLRYKRTQRERIGLEDLFVLLLLATPVLLLALVVLSLLLLWPFSFS